MQKTNIKYLLNYLTIILLFMASLSHAQPKQIAITIDDLPFVGEAQNFHLNMIIDALKQAEVPATGFVIAGRVNDTNRETLQKFHDAGFGIGNHTYSHANLQKIGLNAFITEIDKADKILSPYMRKPKFFRYPYLAMSKAANGVLINEYLQDKKYQLAPITIDSKDYIFNQLLLSVPEKQRREYLEALKPSYIDFIRQQTIRAEEISKIKAQILLIHANLLNAYVLPDIIHLYKDSGYEIIPLANALHPKPAEIIEPPEEELLPLSEE